MPLPKSVTKFDRQGNMSFTSNVDQINYTMEELCRAALRDTGKLVRKRLLAKQMHLPGFLNGNKMRLYRSTQFWNRARSKDLQVGFKADSWYGARSELGTHGQPARGILRTTVYENIGEIQKIQAQYLSALSQETPSLAGTTEDEYKSGDGPE